MDKNVNAQLLAEQQYWVDNILKQYVESNPLLVYDGNDKKRKEKGQKLSHPFYMGISDTYIQCTDKKRVMIVGQEASGYGEIDDGTANYEFIKQNDEIHKEKTNAPKYSQKWAIAYFEKQVYDYESSNCSIAHNRSPFWQLFNKLKEYAVLCWNNLDKVYFGKNLSYEAEFELSRKYREESESVEKSLLQREIELAEPDIILFVTGPYYDLSMSKALGYDNDYIFKEKPSSTKKLINITDIANLPSKRDGKPISTLWTYHPNYLNHISAVDDIVNEIKKFL